MTTSGSGFFMFLFPDTWRFRFCTFVLILILGSYSYLNFAQLISVPVPDVCSVVNTWHITGVNGVLISFPEISYLQIWIRPGLKKNHNRGHR